LGSVVSNDTHHLGFDVGDHRVDLGSVEDIGHHRFGTGLLDLCRLRRLAGQSDDVMAARVQLRSNGIPGTLVAPATKTRISDLPFR
jgi:hypothetical protein